MNFASRRSSESARAGQIEQVGLRTSTRESKSAYTRRSRRRGLVLQQGDGGRRLRTILLFVLAAAVVLAAASAVFWFVFKAQAGSKMHLDDPALAEVLTAPKDLPAGDEEEINDGYYILLAGQFNDPMREDDGPHLLTLVRVEPTRKVLTFISMPNNIEMMMPDENYHFLSYAKLLGGNAELVTQVENLMKVDISHFVQLDSDDFVALVDALGGVEVELTNEADDPDTGPIYIPVGRQVLDGQQALTLVRCDNYTTPLPTRAAVQGRFMEALVRSMLSKSRLGLAFALDKVAGNIETDMSFDDVWALANAYGSGEDMTVYSGIVPGQVTVDPDGTYYSIYRNALDPMMEAVSAGRSPDEAATISGLTPSLVKVSVKNGAGITGGASYLAEMLQSQGYQVPETGNAENYVYDETLIVYKDELMRPTADDILSLVGNGRVIEAGYFYDFDTDILVIIGKDFTPLY